MKLIFCLAHDNLVNSVVVVGYELTSIFLRANKQSLVVDCKNVVICVLQLQKVTLVTKVKSHKSNFKSMDIYIYIGWCSLLFNDCLSEISHFDIFNPYEIEISYRCRTIIVSNLIKYYIVLILRYLVYHKIQITIAFSSCKKIANEMYAIIQGQQ